MSLKTTIAAVMFAASSTIAVAGDTLEIIVPGNMTGAFNTRFQILEPAIEKAIGKEVELNFAGTPARAKVMLDNADGPTLTIWQAMFNISEDSRVNRESMDVLALDTNPHRICAADVSGRTAEDLFTKGAEFTIGHSTPSDLYADWIVGFNKANGTNHKPIPFSSSGNARRGALAGDVDFIFISPSNSNKLMQQGGKCFYTTHPTGEPKHDLPALNTVTDYKAANQRQIYWYGALNVDADTVEALRNMFSEIATNPESEFNEFALTKDIQLISVDSLTADEMDSEISSTIDGWLGK